MLRQKEEAEHSPQLQVEYVKETYSTFLAKIWQPMLGKGEIMKKVAIIGATGSIGTTVRKYLTGKGGYELTLFARHADRLQAADHEHIVIGDVYQAEDLDKTLAGQEAVLAALTGDLGKMAKQIVAAAERNKVEKLIFISSMGIYNEIPASIGTSGNLEHNPVLRTYREGADEVEASKLNYTVIRPGWFDNGGDIQYEVTKKGEPFGGHDVSRKSIADLIYRLLEDHALYARDSVGINRPE